MSGVSTSDSSAIGINSRQWVEPPDLDAPSKFNSEQETIEEQLDESSNRNHGNKEKKRVKFKDDIVHSHFDDTDLWAHGELPGVWFGCHGNLLFQIRTRVHRTWSMLIRESAWQWR